MAWRVDIIEASTIKDATGYKYRLLVKYYDDADPSNAVTPTIFLWTKEFLFDGATLTLQVVQDAVFAEGQKQRLAYTQANQAVALPQLAVGQTYQIP